MPRVRAAAAVPASPPAPGLPLPPAPALPSPPALSRCLICFETSPAPARIPCPRCKDSRAHAECLLPWLLRSGSCPTCREWLIAEPGEEEAEGEDGEPEEDAGDAEEEARARTAPRLHLWPCAMQLLHVVLALGMFATAAEYPDPQHPQHLAAANIVLFVHLACDAIMFFLLVSGELSAEGQQARSNDAAGQGRDRGAAGAAFSSFPYLVLCCYVIMVGGVIGGCAAIMEGLPGSPANGALLHLTYLCTAYAVLFLYAVPAMLSPCTLWRAQYLCLSLIFGMLTALMRSTADAGLVLAVVVGLGGFLFVTSVAAGV